MCDTLVALGNTTADGSVLFAKNSDREPNEAHQLVIVPHATHAPGSSLACTYVEIPQVEETYAVLLAKPFWIWGAEMGANEKGVVIGNEAVFTKVPQEKGPRLIGMDLLRLGLERGATARQALEVITSLLEAHGQGGNCGYTHPFYYHNSFILADPQEAWVLETAGRHWAAKRVQDVYSISNAITIGRVWDLSSARLVDYAVDRGWCKSREDFDFGRCYSDFLYTRLSDARPRQCRTTDLLRENRGKLSPAHLMAYLRDHGHTKRATSHQGHGLTGNDVCYHAGFGPVRASQSVGSQVSHLSPELQTHWLTGTSAPCTGVFKPVWLDSGLPAAGLSPQGQYDAGTLWWRHEVLHREVLQDYANRLALYQPERDELEKRFLSAWSAVCAAPVEERARFTYYCFDEADKATAVWSERVSNAPARSQPPYLYRRAWQGFNLQAQMPE